MRAVTKSVTKAGTKAVTKAGALVVGRGMPAAVLRLAILVVGAAIVLVPLREGTTTGTLVILLPAVLASVYAPASPAPAGVVISVAVLVALVDLGPLRAEVLVLIPLVHLFHVVCGLAGVLPASGRVHLRALRAPALRFLLVQAVMAVVVVLVALLPAGRTPPLLEVVGLVGLAGIAALVLVLQRVK
jgi:hypothetical protein